jgi:hypothetical protein
MDETVNQTGSTTLSYTPAALGIRLATPPIIPLKRPQMAVEKVRVILRGMLYYSVYLIGGISY